ncbi:flavin reductase [candidate division WOR-3 bacterium]|nr:flavin reductase [candidate division WOR-3 bacterium]
MKIEFSDNDVKYVEPWPGASKLFPWKELITAVPSVIFLVTTYKDNGKPNACLQSWSTFFSDKGELLCIFGHVSKSGHMFSSLLKTKECVINFPYPEIFDKCLATIKNNDFEDDEITKSGLTVEKAVSVNAPRVAECFLSLESEFLWEKATFTDGRGVSICVRVKHVAMDPEYFDEEKKGRYGRTGYIYNINEPLNPITGLTNSFSIGAIEKQRPIK